MTVEVTREKFVEDQSGKMVLQNQTVRIGPHDEIEFYRGKSGYGVIVDGKSWDTGRTKFCGTIQVKGGGSRDFYHPIEKGHTFSGGFNSEKGELYMGSDPPAGYKKFKVKGV